MQAKILPLRLYVDQDAVDFLKKFFSFKDPGAPSETTSSVNETYIRMLTIPVWRIIFADHHEEFAEVFPILLKLDYKPRRVDYKALREGRTIELMNFFHFDGAEMTLRHITLSGVSSSS
jgi:autophagy-related protein 2